jgi:hypothetical protein
VHPSSCRCQKLTLDQLKVQFSWARDYVLFRLDKIRTHRARAMEKAIQSFCTSVELNVSGKPNEAELRYCEAIDRLRTIKADMPHSPLKAA